VHYAAAVGRQIRDAMTWNDVMTFFIRACSNKGDGDASRLYTPKLY